VIRVDVVRAWPRRHASASLQLPDGATVADAIAGCGLSLEGISGQAVFGERVATDARLRDGDRLELLPPLRMDPGEARRRRAAAPR
jgi:putative ubiquitin-RnfH superfamily antitoxin RatB of RatAB toxin-antitoxin module